MSKTGLPGFVLVTSVARSCPWTGCVPWLSSSVQQYWCCAGSRPPQGIYQGRELDTGTVEEPYSASPGPLKGEDENEDGDGEGS